MPDTAILPRSRLKPLWLFGVASAGIAWNLYGTLQFAKSVTATAETLVASGLTPQQAAVMTSYPGWMTIAFAIGVIGGLIGSILLMLRKGLAGPVLATSLVAYIALWIGDLANGVFAAMGTAQVIILTIVVAIAAGLYVTSRHPAARA